MYQISVLTAYNKVYTIYQNILLKIIYYFLRFLSSLVLQSPMLIFIFFFLLFGVAFIKEDRSIDQSGFFKGKSILWCKLYFTYDINRLKIFKLVKATGRNDNILH